MPVTSQFVFPVDVVAFWLGMLLRVPKSGLVRYDMAFLACTVLGHSVIAEVARSARNGPATSVAVKAGGDLDRGLTSV